MSDFRRTPVLALALAGFLTQFDVTAVVVILPSIGKELGFGISGYAWVMDAYSLAFTAALLASGALADRFGRRLALLAGNVVFAAASLLCAVSWDGPSLWLARGLQGIGAAFVITGSFALIAGICPEPGARARAFGLAGIVSGVAMAIGPTLGGVLATWPGWRWIFLANLPVCAATIWIVPKLVGESRDDAGRPIDPLGIALLTLALGLVIESLLSAHQSPTRLLAGSGAGGVFLALFVWQQQHRAVPVLDPALLRQKAMIAVSLLLITVSVAYWAVLVYLPLFLQARFGFTIEWTGLVMLAATFPMVVLPPYAGALAPRWGWRRLFATGLVVIALGDAVLAATFLDALAIDPLWPVLSGMAVIAIGAALVQAQLSGAVVALAPPAQAGMASALTIVMRQGGFAVGIAGLGATVSSGYAVLFLAAMAAAVVGAASTALLGPRSGR
ncbi:MFS transporter [Reyranella soli]|uniref:MFS transporter n=1 Tax=Reyranella soli TaxID=1230389 RepID=A0A512NEZ7_9HYPH|nr:MFS transporter [Reyranella soli]GEP57516.1 MFS transporter [Reyranella soli]